jgi:hypothetical protein
VNPDLPPEYLANWNQKDKAQRGEMAATSLILLSLVPTKDGLKAAASLPVLFITTESG